MRNQKYSDQLQREYKRLQEQNNRITEKLHAQISEDQQKIKTLRRERQDAEYELKNKMTRTKMEYEARMRGLLPKSVKTDYDETVACLREQVKNLERKLILLEDSCLMDDEDVSCVDLDDSNLLRDSVMMSNS